MKTSLILPSFKRHRLLYYGLYSIAKYNYADLEIIVVNDGVEDNDATKEVCEMFPTLGIKYIFSGSRNKGSMIWRVPGFAINIGVKHASGDIIVLSSPEIFHLNSALTLLLKDIHHDSRTVSIPKFMYFDDDGIILQFIEEDRDNLGNLDENSIILHKFVIRAKERESTRMPFLMAMHKSRFYDIGGYDEDFIGYAADDNDFVERLLDSGCFYNKTNAKIVHLFHEGTNIVPLAHEDNPAWVYNFNLWKSRKGQLVRNQNREWGVSY